MKKTPLFLLLVLISSFVYAQGAYLKAKVDERCELMSTVFRLAEAQEYVTHEVPVYVDSLDNYFKPFKNHEIIDYCKIYRENYGVGYDAPMNLAVRLQIVDGQVSLNPNIKEEGLDSRWEQKYLPRFIELLNDFYNTSNFHNFFVGQREFIGKVEQTATEYFQKIDMDWFKKFYGEAPVGNYNLVISLTNGNSNYGASVTYLNGNKDVYSIILCAIDSLNNPLFEDRWALNLVTHEFCHSFCNQLIDNNYNKMKKKADVFST